MSNLCTDVGAKARVSRYFLFRIWIVLVFSFYEVLTPMEDLLLLPESVGLLFRTFLTPGPVLKSVLLLALL